MFNFKDTKPAEGFVFLNPGVHALTPIDVVFGSHSTGTPYAAITFVNEDGVKLVEKFNISDNTIARLQYFHNAFFGNLCNKNFETAEEVAEYFKKCVKAKKITKNVIVGGKISNGKVYAELPYTGFVDSEGKFPVGDFAKDSEEWKEFVQIAKTAVDGKKQGIINGSDDDDDAPKKSTPSAPAKTTKAKATVADEPLPWE